jgi:hypothetical protein
VWGYCGSRYGLNEADVTCALSCVSPLRNIKDKSITVGEQDQPRLLCDRDTAKIWISPFLNKSYLPVQGSLTFRAANIQNLALQGVLYCCGDGRASTCSVWGLISEVLGCNDVLISINNAGIPGPVPCNPLLVALSEVKHVVTWCHRADRNGIWRIGGRGKELGTSRSIVIIVSILSSNMAIPLRSVHCLYCNE